MVPARRLVDRRATVHLNSHARARRDSTSGPVHRTAGRDTLRELLQHVMQPGFDYGDEFEYGLDLILEGLDTARASEMLDATGAKCPGRCRS